MAIGWQHYGAPATSTGTFSTILPIVLWICTIGWQAFGAARPTQVTQEEYDNKEWRALGGVRREFCECGAGWSHETWPCVYISQQAARRNARAASRKSSPGIAAPAGPPRAIQPDSRARLSRCACRPSRDGRRQHLASGGHGVSPGPPRLAARPSQRNRPASNPPAGRRWAASLQQARFCLSGASRLRFGHLERRESTHCWRMGRLGLQAGAMPPIRWPSRETLNSGLVLVEVPQGEREPQNWRRGEFRRPLARTGTGTD